MKIKIHYSMYIFVLISIIFNFYIQFFLMIIILFLHELGHLYLLHKFKREIKSLTLFPFGGIILHSNSCNEKNHQDLLINSGGIIVNIIILILTYIFKLKLLYITNILILMFNILPIYPLDGGKILKSIFAYLFNYKLTMKISAFISFTAICSLVIINIIYIKSAYIIFLCLALIKLNYDYISTIKKEYQFFLTNKYLYPNEFLKVKKIYHFRLPINKLYLGKNSLFIFQDLKVKEYDILKKHFKEKIN